MKHFDPEYQYINDSPVDLSGIEGAPREQWVFTFGFGHVDPNTDTSLASRYVVIDGDVSETREKMLERFGRQWAMQYRNDDAASKMIQKYNLKELPL